MPATQLELEALNANTIAIDKLFRDAISINEHDPQANLIPTSKILVQEGTNTPQYIEITQIANYILSLSLQKTSTFIDNIDSPYDATNKQVIFADCTNGDIQINLPNPTTPNIDIEVVRIDDTNNNLTVDITEMNTKDLSYNFFSDGAQYRIK